MFPVPRHVEHLGGEGSAATVEVIHDPTLPAQGYELVVAAAGTTIRHADEAGLRYAGATLAALGVESPMRAQRIVDHPDHLQRGFMLDISRDRVPTNETLDWLVDVLAMLRYNHLELYMEHTFAYAGHEEVWQDASPLSVEDLQRLERRCESHGIALVANQNTFGHMERWLRHDAHRWRAECPDGATSPFSGRPMAPSTLAPTPDNARFALGLVRELLSHLSSRLVNIGADEPFELGQGASARDVAQRGRAAVYLEHLNRLIEPLVADGHHVLFWGDVLRRHPHLVEQLPTAGATAVVWNYEAPSGELGLLAGLGPDLLDTLGLPDDAHLGFSSHARSFVDTGYPFWVAPGTSSWNTLLGRWTNARENLLDAAIVGRDQGAGGYLVADWGDNGHLQPLAISLLPLVYGAGVAWCAHANADHEVTVEVDALVGVDGLGSLLDDLGDLYGRSGVATFNGSPLFAALDPTRPLPLIGKGEPTAHADTLEELEGALERVGRLPSVGERAIPDELDAVVRLARQGAWRLAARAGVLVPDAEVRAADLIECVARQRAAWLTSSRPGGLDDSLRHIG
ncbi:MAG: family 20 glycosylhydrolase [Microthrixaceae bacterium]